MAKVILSEVGDVIFEGTDQECATVMRAFNNYNDCFGIALEEDRKFLDKDIREKIICCLNDMEADMISDMGSREIQDCYCGHDHYNDDELIDSIEVHEDYDDDRPMQKIIAEGVAQRIIADVFMSCEGEE